MAEPDAKKYSIVQKQVPTFYFIGVTTTKSSIMKIFPHWTRELGHPDVILRGVDLKLNDNPAAYRQAVAQIKYDPNSLGALVTTHKINLYQAAHDLFDAFDPFAKMCGEVSCISKRDGRLEGHAKDPQTSGATLDAMLGKNYFAHTGGQVLAFGPGGATTAIALHFIHTPNAGDRPRRFVVVGHKQSELDRLKKILAAQTTDIFFEYILNDAPETNDALMAQMPRASVIINATGMGKDLPGSPITDSGLFPEQGVAWELNYRGALDFLHQAKRQRDTRGIYVQDGWLYFLYGWTQVISQVYHMPIQGELFERLSHTAERIMAAP